jgi:hypothetical protein
MVKSTSLKLLKRQLKYCQGVKRRTRFGQEIDDIIKKNEEARAKLKLEAEKKAEEDAKKKAEKEKKEKSAKRWNMARNIAIGVGVAGLGVAAARTGAGKKLTSQATNVVSGAARDTANTVKGAGNSAAGLVGMSSQQRANRQAANEHIKATNENFNKQAAANNMTPVQLHTALANQSQLTRTDNPCKKMGSSMPGTTAKIQCDAWKRAHQNAGLTVPGKLPLPHNPNYEPNLHLKKELTDSELRTLTPTEVKTRQQAISEQKARIDAASGRAKLRGALGNKEGLAKIKENNEKEDLAKRTQEMKKNDDIQKEKERIEREQRAKIIKAREQAAQQEKKDADAKAKQQAEQKLEIAKMSAAAKAAAAAQKTPFGKSRVTKRLKQLCKKHGVRLTVTRNGKRYPKPQKTLSKQLKNKMR